MAVRSEGQFLGEMAMFATAAVRCASVRAKGPVRVKIVPGEQLMDLSPEVGMMLKGMPGQPTHTHTLFSAKSGCSLCFEELVKPLPLQFCVRQSVQHVQLLF